jgi:hypothetical protein
MNKILCNLQVGLSLALCSLALSPVSTTAQSRTAGQMVVAPGWENRDSIRFAIFAPFSYGPFNTEPILNREMDTLMANSIGYFGPIDLGYSPIGDRAHGDICSLSGTVLDNLPAVKQRIFYAESQPDISLNGWIINDNGNFFRYIDNTGQFHNNEYDANDISPYMEFPQSSDSVKQTFTSSRYGSPQTLCFGLEGKTVLGYNDARMATNNPSVSIPSNLLATYASYPFGSRWRRDSVWGYDHVHLDSAWIPDTVVLSDTARNFAAILEFNIDTSTILMDSSRGLPKDSLPLVRLQITFKNGNDSTSVSVLPYVPFKTPTNPTAAGWYLALDTTITLAIYRTMKDTSNAIDWRSPDVLNGNSRALSHSGGWRFKQLHVLLKPDTDMKGIMAASITNDTKGTYGESSGSPAFSRRVNQDEIVNCDTTISGLPNLPLIEMEVLSTFRAPLRVRSLCWQDTMADKYFYRKRINSDSTHSLSLNGTPGGYDDSIMHALHLIDLTVPAGVSREFLVTDYGPQSYLSASVMGLWDYLCGKYKRFSVHLHEQDGGGWVEQYRRERMSHNDVPPAMIENEATYLYAPFRYANDVFPLDYLYGGWHDSVNFATTWPQSFDNVGTMEIGRTDTTADSLKAYEQYTAQWAGMATNDFILHSRQMALNAKNHPETKRFAIEQGIQGWGLNAGPKYTYPTYDQRPTTPEETICQTFAYIANGVTSFNNAQAFDGTSVVNDFGPGVFCPTATYMGYPAKGNADTLYVHDYNFGHHRFPWYSSSPVDSDGVKHSRYFGYSNHYRAHVAVLKRINQIYPTLKTLTWRNAYSAHRSSNIVNADSATKRDAFLKIQYTQPVNRWLRNADKSYIDSTSRKDSPTQTFVEVGLFDDSSKHNHAALLVNTRMWPSLMDSSDVAYYNAGLLAKDQCHTTLGDIDVRKVFMRIDNTQLPVGDTGAYYVVHDLWHPDTSWLVKSDSAFAVYLKPGDAKFLYFQKGYSILASKTAEADTLGFSFNNGRRVAERVKSSQTVECYTRNHKLYVSYAAFGSTFAGQNERSQADAIATGFEQLLDTNFCAVPSITVGQNDTTVALTYIRRFAAGQWRVMVLLQNGIGQPWYSDTLPGTYYDTSANFSYITPVIAPSNALDYVVIAANSTSNASPYKLLATRFKVGSAPYTSNSTTLFSDTLPLLFPTVASRPLDSTFWPIRYAWQRNDHIYYAQARDTTFDGSIFFTQPFEVNPVYKKPRRLDRYLPGCVHRHPSIAVGGILDESLPTPVWVSYPTAIIPCLGCSSTLSIKSGFPSKYPMGAPSVEDFVTWESQLNTHKVIDSLNSGKNFWPVETGNHQQMLNAGSKYIAGAVSWGGYNIFPQYNTDTVAFDTLYHYPQVSEGTRIWDLAHEYFYDGIDAQYHDWTRIVWQNRTNNANHPDTMECVGWIPGWQRTEFNDMGNYPSDAQATDSLSHWTDSSTVPRSIVFVDGSVDAADGYRAVHVTNGWMPLLGTPIHAYPKPGWSVYWSDTTVDNCPNVLANIEVGTGQLSTTGGSVPVIWNSPNIARPYTEDATWPVIPSYPAEVRTKTFKYNAGSSLFLPRVVDTIDVNGIKNALSTDSDYFICWTALWKASDSTLIATLDSMMIMKGGATLPTALDSGAITYHFAGGIPSDSAFITTDVYRGDTTDTLARIYRERSISDTLYPSFKRAAKQVPADEPIALFVHPNPFNQQTYLDVMGPSGPATTIIVYDILGRTVQKLYDGLMPSSEALHFTFDGQGLTSGTYFVRVTSGNQVVTRRLQLIK